MYHSTLHDIDAPAEEILGRDPGAVYLRSDPRTQWLYRAALRRLAQRAGLDLATVARHALARAEGAQVRGGSDGRDAHIGYYLLGSGSRTLEMDLGLQSNPRVEPHGRGIAPSYFIPLSLALTCLFLLTCVALVHWSRVPAWAQILTAICAIPLASLYSSRIVTSLPWRGRAGLPLPSVRAGEELAPKEAVLIVVPALVPSPERARALVQRLWLLSRTHRGDRFRFLLLSDFVDAPAQHAAGDGEILRELGAAVAELNARAGDALGDRFFALHRRRTWSATQQAWIGWDRKLGKLLELMRLLREGSEGTMFSWQFGDLPALLARVSVPFVISLDEASWLDAAAARELIRTAAHPLNRARLDTETGRVLSGYAVFQPQLRYTLDARPEAEEVAAAVPPMGRLPAHASAALSFYFRAFDVGVPKGPGALYDVDAFRSLEGIFEQDSLLHEDLLVGFLGRTGEVPDAVVVQPWPRSFLAQARRGHRWLRGLFQASTYLLPRTRNASGVQVRNPLSGIQRHYLAELLFQQLASPASLLLLLLAWTQLPGPWAWTLLACPALLSLTAAVLHDAFTAPLRPLKKRRPRPLRAHLFRLPAAVFEVTALVCNSVVTIDALARVSWRLAVSRKHLLDWAPRSDLAASAPLPLSVYYRALWPSPVVGGVAILALALWHPATLPLALPFGGAWILAPAVIGLGDRHLFGRVEGG